MNPFLMCGRPHIRRELPVSQDASGRVRVKTRRILDFGVLEFACKVLIVWKSTQSS